MKVNRFVMKALWVMIVIFLFFPNVTIGQNIKVEYENETLPMDSIVLYDSVGERLGMYNHTIIDSLINNELITVLYFTTNSWCIFKKHRSLCLNINYKLNMCDTVTVELYRLFASNDFYNIGSIRTCKGGGHVYGIQPFNYPCCDSLLYELHHGTPAQTK